MAKFLDNVEFISYDLTMDDPFAIGIATIRLFKSIVIKLKMARKKDGGTFLCKPSYMVVEHGEKKNVEAFFLDSQLDDRMLTDYVRSKIKESEPASTIVENPTPF